MPETVSKVSTLITINGRQTAVCETMDEIMDVLSANTFDGWTRLTLENGARILIRLSSVDSLSEVV
jgi:hypothetical protein